MARRSSRLLSSSNEPKTATAFDRMNYFITGTDTGVGKTLVSCALLHGFAGQGKRVVGMKPVAAGGSLRSNGEPTGVLLAGAAGCADGGQHEYVRQLRASSNVLASGGDIKPHCFAQ